ncbi:hypothetical protein BKK49_02100 [Rodentibacter rarus]|uniref:hypothetical protein n=1 Tax=Rodentibacter rarus TaxID=1908260 RepID=UPI0009859D63|nr:hypothetical protein [Rodentibacter rarus]OOF42609.1 hypothetical protein BKK49_02100 [Rodentibacter rarus]
MQIIFLLFFLGLTFIEFLIIVFFGLLLFPFMPIPEGGISGLIDSSIYSLNAFMMLFIYLVIAIALVFITIYISKKPFTLNKKLFKKITVEPLKKTIKLSLKFYKHIGEKQ